MKLISAKNAVFVLLEYLISISWFFVTAALEFITFERWGQPILLERIFFYDAFLSLVMFIAPALLFGSIVCFRKKGILITSVLSIATHVFYFTFISKTADES